MNTGSSKRGLIGTTLMLALVSCVSVNMEQRANPVRRYFVLDASGNSIVSQSNRMGVLKLAPVRVAHRYDGKGFTYRIAAESFETDFYNQFLVAPGPMLTDELRQVLGQANLFQVVVDSNSLIEPTHLLEAMVDALYGDFSGDEHGKAVLGMSFLMRRQAAGGTQTMFQKHYEKTVPLQARSPAALVQGWNRALDEIVTALITDLRSTR